MPWWFRSFLIILTGLLLLLASDVAARSAGGALGDANALRLAGAALMGVGVCVGLGTIKQPRKRARKS